jgi:hypothetical protein
MGLTAPRVQRRGSTEMADEKIDKDALARIALAKYAEWLNLWIAEDRTPQWPIVDLTVDDFFKYEGETEILGLVEIGGWRNYLHMVIRAGYGDEGGPSFIFATFRNDLLDGHPELVFMVQEFDTYIQAIYDVVYNDQKREFAEKFLNGPKEK